MSRVILVAKARILLFLAFSLLLASQLWAGGAQSDPIETARELIIQRKYQEASKILEDLIRNDPERIDDAEALLSTIRDTTRRYNDLAAQLVTLLENDPENYDGAVALIDQMNQIYLNPNPRIQQQLREARRTAKLQVDRRRRDEIFASALVAIRDGDLEAATTIYLSGIGLQYPEFLELDPGATIVSRAEDLRRTFLETGPRISALLTSWRSRYSRYRQALGQRLGATLASLPDPGELRILPPDREQAGSPRAGPAPAVVLPGPGIPSQLLDLASTHEALVAEFGNLQSFVGELEALGEAFLALNAESRDSLDHLVFIQQFTTGRSEYGQGLADSVVHTWARDTLALRDQALAAILAQLDSADEIRKSEPQRAGNLQRAAFLAATDLWQVLASYAAIGDAADSSFAGDDEPVFQAIVRAKADLLRTFAEAGLAEARLGDPVAGVPAAFGSLVESVRVRNQLKSSILTNATEIRDAMAAFTSQAWSPVQSGMLVLRSEFDDLRFDIAGFESWLAGFDSGLSNEREAFVQRLYGQELAAMEDQLGSARGLHAEALRQQNGIPDDSGLVRRHPDRALTALANSARLAAEVRTRYAPTAAFGQQEDWTADSPAFEANIPLIADLGQRLAVLEADISAAQVSARAQIAEHDRFVASGDTAISQSRQAIGARNIDQANARLELASHAYLSALELFDNPATRERYNQVYAAVAAEIQDLGNEIAIAQINQLIDRAQAAYTRDQFADALAMVLEAEGIQDANPSLVPNPYIADLRDRISSANSVARERVLGESDPLYSTISQLLNSAQVNIDEGIRQVRAGNQAEAGRRFELAQASIDNVLFVKPFNFRAKILALRIIQVTRTAAEFNDIFRSRYSDTVSRMNKTDQSEVDILNELEALYNINANYPGLLGNLNTMKIRLGIMEDPITVERQAQATALVTRARQMLVNANRATLEAALALADQARSLDRTSRAAQLLSDEIRVQLGRATAASLSADDTFKFRQAQQLFSQRNLTEAGVIVEALWSVPQNQNYPPLRTLRQNIFGGAR